MKKLKTSSIISLLSITAVGVAITLVVLSTPAGKQISTPLEGLKAGELIAMSDEDRVEEKSFSLSPGDSLNTMEQTAAVVKKRFERIRAEKILLADKEKLITLLSPVPGWKLENPQYHRGGYGEEETTNLNAVFTGPDSRQIQVEIIDYGAAPAALQPLKMIFKMERGEETEIRNGKVASYNENLVLEEFSRRTKQRQFSSILKNRYLVKLILQGNDTQDVLQDFTRRVFGGK